jgi:hypothetical protein
MLEPEAYYEPWPESEDLLVGEALDRLAADRYHGNERLAALALHERIFDASLAVAMRCFLKLQCRDVWTLADLREFESGMGSEHPATINGDVDEADVSDIDRAHVFIRFLAEPDLLAEPGLAADALRSCYNAFHLPQFNRVFPMRAVRAAPDPTAAPAAQPGKLAESAGAPQLPKPARRKRGEENEIAIELAVQLLSQEPITNDNLYECLATGQAPDGTPLIWEGKPMTWDHPWPRNRFDTEVLPEINKRPEVDPSRKKGGRPRKRK